MSQGGTLKIAALGRPFRLGMLYDCRKDALIPAMTLWDEKVLEQDVVNRAQKNSNFQIIASDSLNDKAKALNVDANLKLSIMGGLINLSGSAQYLDDRVKSSRQERVTLNYKCTTQFEQLSMIHLGKGNVQHPDVFASNEATHVVTGIVYGGNACLVLEKQHNLESTSTEIDGSGSASIKYIPSFEIHGGANLKFSDQNKKRGEKINVKFYGDIVLESNPTDFDSAMKLAKDLPRLMEGKLVPVMVWLYPLVKLGSKACKMVREISETMVLKVEKVFEEIHKYNVQCEDFVDLLNRNKVPLTSLTEETKRLQSNLEAYRIHFQKQVINVLPKVRGGGREESVLAEILLEHEKSPFSKNAVSTWLGQNWKEYKTLVEGCLEYMKDVDIASEPAEVENACFDFGTDFLVCFTFRRPNKNILLDTMENYLCKRNGSAVYDMRVKRNMNIKSIRQNGKAFVDFFHSNKATSKTKCLVAEDVTDVENTEGCIYLYQEGELIDKNYQPPGQVTDLYIASKTNESVTLKWKVPELGSKNIVKHEVEYHAEHDQRATCVSTTGETRAFQVSNLQGGTKYYFKIRAQAVSGNGPYSGEVGPILLETKQVFVKERNLLIQPKSATSPAIYRLKKTKRKISDTLFKCQIGNAPVKQKPNKVIMILGATGSGKSTLINAMINYIFDVQWENDYRLKLIEESLEKEANQAKSQTSKLIEESLEKEVNQAKSQTSTITAYTIHHQVGFKISYSVTVIDTPGFGDTSGIVRDKEITKQIQQFFKTEGRDGIDHLDAIGFVAQSSLPRLTPTQRYIFDSILALFGKDIEKNILMLLTFADAQQPQVLAGINEAKLTYANFFKFNNSVLYVSNEESNRQDAEFNKMFWKMGIQSFECFLDELGKMQAQSLVMTKEVLQERENIENNIESLHFQIRAGLGTLDQLNQELDVVKSHQADIDRNKDFEVTVTTDKQVKVDAPAGTHTTNCLKCNFTCHPNCAYSNDDEKAKCTAMKSNGYCKNCPEECHWTEHKNTPYWIEIQQVTEKKTAKEVFQRFTDAQGKMITAKDMLIHILDEFEAIQLDVITKTDHVRRSLKRLDEIALKPNPLSTPDYIDTLILSERQGGLPGWSNRVKQLERVKEQAQRMQELADAGHDPFKDYQEKIKEARQMRPNDEGLLEKVWNKAKKVKKFFSRS